MARERCLTHSGHFEIASGRAGSSNVLSVDRLLNIGKIVAEVAFFKRSVFILVYWLTLEGLRHQGASVYVEKLLLELVGSDLRDFVLRVLAPQLGHACLAEVARRVIRRTNSFAQVTLLLTRVV